jgi:membrane-associated phospholipid phosphatase
MLARAGRFLPRGWGDLGLQLFIWFGFAAVYQIARGTADRSALEAFQNGRHVISIERGLHSLVELDLQRVILHAGGFVLGAVNWTYWLAQFVVLALALLWIYLFRYDAFHRVRNWVLATNLIALVGYALIPTAPPRMFPDDGFVDTLASAASLNHGSGFIQLASNQFAAMPSVHSADAFVIGFAMAMLVRSRLAAILWTLWPTWVWFSVMATGNHFWLDVAAGVGVALFAGALLAWMENRRLDELAAPATICGP